MTSLALVPIKIIGAGWGTLWHTFHMAQTVLGRKDSVGKGTYAFDQGLYKDGCDSDRV